MHIFFSKRAVWLLLASLVCTSAWAGQTNAPPARNCLWKVSSPSNHVYMQGSIHLLKKEHYPLAEPIERAFAESRILMLETDLAAATDLSQQMLMLSKGMLQGEATLENSLRPATYTMATAAVKEMGLDIQVFRKFKPWYFALMLTVTKLQKLGFNPMDGIDWHLFNRARSGGKTVIGLETLEFQIGLFESIDATDQDELVRQTLEDFGTVEQEMATIIHAWRSGDVKGLEQTLLKHFGEHPKIYETLIVSRNRNWIPKIEQLLASTRRAMVVVGAGHLVGKDSLVDLLRKKGYRVEQL